MENENENENEIKNNNVKENFLYPIGNYQGEFTPSNIVFNANLQEFAQRVSYICGLESNNKISTHEAYNQIKNLWHKLKKSKKELLDKKSSEIED